MIGKSAGLTFRYVGGLGRSFGKSPVAALIAVTTSTAAPSILRDRSNCNVIDIRQRRNRQQPIGADAEYQDTQHQKRGPYRPPDERFRNAHRRLPALLLK